MGHESLWSCPGQQKIIMGRRKEYQREKVIGMAMNTFWDKGFQATSLTDLTNATGLNKKTLYAEFESKQGVFDAALSLYTSMGVAQAEQFLTAEPLGLENIRRYFLAMDYEPSCRGCLMTMTINQKNLVDESSMTLVRRALERIEALLRQNLTAAAAAGDLEDPAAVDRLATFLIFSIQGITTMGKYEGNRQKLAYTVETILSLLN